MIIFISDFDLTGSGYMNIAIAVCKDLADRGYNVMALGIGYTGNEHDWPFTILPVNTRQAFVHIPAMLQNLRTLEQAGQVPQIQAIVVALDIPMHERLLSMPMRQGIPYIGIFPIESGPLCQTWANVLNGMDEACVISKFGLDQMIDISVEGRYLPIGLDTEAWRRPLPKEREKLRQAMGYTNDQLVVLTVADNQERKNLSAAMEAIRIAAEKGVDVQWMLVTRIASQVGWKLDDMAIGKGVMDRFVKFERGLDFQKLWTLYSIADVFLLTSKAEGLCMPLMEAMATGAVVIATDCTAVPEHLFEDRGERKGQRGFLIDSEYLHQDPWGNSIRTYADAEDAADLLSLVNEMKISGTLEQDIIAPARAYVESRTWEKCGDILDEAIRNVMLKEVPFNRERADLEPATVPRVIPIPEEIDDQTQGPEGQGQAQGPEGPEGPQAPQTDFAATVPSATKPSETEGEEASS